METRANFVLIGAFTLAVIAAAFGFVLWFQSLHTTKARSPIRVVFEGPATGLRNGGSVNFNGIRVGEVISVKLDNPRRVIALAMVENKAPIRKDTLVGLEFQGLTGVAAISLKGGEEAAPPVPLDEDGIPVLTADPSALQDVTEAIRATLQNVNRIVSDNQDSVKNSLRNLETFTGALARNSEKIDNVMLKVDGVMGKADSLMLGLDSIAGGKNGGELAAMVKAIKDLAEDFDKRSGLLMADGRRTLGDISRAVNNLDRNPTRLLFGAGNSERRRGRPQRVRGRAGSSSEVSRAASAGVRVERTTPPQSTLPLASSERARLRSAPTSGERRNAARMPPFLGGSLAMRFTFLRKRGAFAPLRHCERSEAIHSFFAGQDGLLRCARNDVERVGPSSRRRAYTNVSEILPVWFQRLDQSHFLPS